MVDIDSFIISSVDLLQKSGALDAVVGVTKEYLYYKILEGVTSALALSTFFTWPSYWACVTPEDYETALDYVFGEEGSEKRKEYAGLIAKIEKYHNEVKLNLGNVYQQLKDDKVNVMVLSKYGRQIIPECESVDQVADQYVTVKRSSYGATTANSIYETLSEDYIAQRVAEGKGKYISPDKQIDASTCTFKDSTWFFKGVNHGDYPRFENKLLFTVVSADRQLTVEDFDFSRFLVFEIHKDIDSDTYYTDYLYTHEDMTEENCHNEAWTAKETIDKPQTMFEKLFAFIASLVDWFINLFKFVGKE